MKDCKLAGEWLENCLRDAKVELGLDDADIADMLLKEGINRYLKSLTRCETCPLKVSRQG